LIVKISICRILMMLWVGCENFVLGKVSKMDPRTTLL